MGSTLWHGAASGTHTENAVRILAENHLLRGLNFHILFSSCTAEARSFSAPVLAFYIHKNATGPMIIPFPIFDLNWRRDMMVRAVAEASGKQYLPFEQRVDKLFWRGNLGNTWWDCERVLPETCALLFEDANIHGDYLKAYARALRVNVRSLHFNWLLLNRELEKSSAPPFVREVPTEQKGPRSLLVSLSAENPHMIDARGSDASREGHFTNVQVSRAMASNADMIGHRYNAIIDGEDPSSNID
jgi:hypothetical protein